MDSSELALLRQNAGKAAALLRAAGNENRLLVLCLLIGHGELSVGQILDRLDLSPSALSQHLSRMRDEGLVANRREAQTLFYRIANPAVEALVGALKSIYCAGENDDENP